MAKYKKKRVRELKQDKFRDTAMKVIDRVGDRLEGQGRSILYGIGGVIIVVAVVWFFISWSNRAILLRPTSSTLIGIKASAS